MNIEEFSQIQNLEDIVRYAFALSREDIRKVKVSDNAPGELSRVAQTKGWAEGVKILNRLKYNLEDFFITQLNKYSIERLLFANNMAATIGGDYYDWLVNNKYITNEDSYPYTAYLIFVSSPYRNIRDILIDLIITNTVDIEAINSKEELVELCNKVSQKAFRNPSDCKATPYDRAFAIIIYTVILAGLLKLYSRENGKNSILDRIYSVYNYSEEP